MLVIVGSVIVLALFSALIVPYFVDWSSYRSAFEQQASRVLGHKVEVLGETKVRLLPLPSVTFDTISVGENPDKSPLLIADRFAMDIELTPLLSGDVRIVEINLLRPRLNLQIDEQGRVPWTSPSTLPVDPGQIELEKFNITNGEIRINGLAVAENLVIEQIDAKLSAQSLFGPWKVDAEGFVGNKRARFDITTGRYQESGEIRVRVGAEGQSYPYRLVADGQMSVVSELLEWNGKFSIDGTEGSGSSIKPLPVHVEGLFAANPKRIDLGEFDLDIGGGEDPYSIKGSGRIDLAENVFFNISAKGRQVDVDRLAGSKNDEVATGLSFAERLSFSKSILRDFPVPPFPGIVQLTLPAIVAGDTTIRDVSAKFSPLDEGWQIESAAATLPGNTKVEMSGNLNAHPFGFEGRALVASRQPTGFANWLGNDNSKAVRKLKRAGFTGKIKVNDASLVVEDLELILGDNSLKGSLERREKAAGGHTLKTKLAGSEIDIDQLRAIASLFSDGEGARLSSHDLDIEFTAERLLVGGLKASDVDLKLVASGELLALDRLNVADAFGTKISGNGRIKGISTEPDGGGQISIQAKDPSELFKVIGERYPKLAAQIAFLNSPELAQDLNVRINGKVSTEPNGELFGGLISYEGKAGATNIKGEAEITAKVKGAEIVNINANWGADNANGAILARQMFGNWVEEAAEIPHLRVTGLLNGSATKGFDGRLTLTSKQSNVNIRGLGMRVQSSRSDASLFKALNGKFDIKGASENLQELSGLSSGFGKLLTRAQSGPAGYFDISSELQEDGRWTATGDGAIASNAIAVDLTGEPVGNSYRVSGEASGDSLDLETVLKLQSGVVAKDEVSGETSSDSNWSASNFGSPLWPGTKAKLNLKFDEVRIFDNWRLLNATGEISIGDEGIFFNGVKAITLGGELDTNASFSNKLGTGSFSAQFKLAGADAKLVQDQAGFRPLLDAPLKISGNLEGFGNSPRAIIASMTGSGAVEVGKGSVAGVNPDPIGPVFIGVDKKDVQISEDVVRPLLAPGFSEGTMNFDAISAPFNISAGKLQSRNVTFDDGRVRANAGLQTNLLDRQTNIKISMTYDPGLEWVEGVEPQATATVEGKPGRLVRTLDVQELTGFLSLRRFEQEQRKVDMLQASIMEKQRLRSDIVLSNQRIRHRKALAQKALRRSRQALIKKHEIQRRARAAVEHARLLDEELRAEQEAAKRAAEEERKRQEEARKAAEAAEKARLEEEARKAAEEARKAEAADAKRKSEEAAKLAREREAAESERRKREAAEKANQEAVTAGKEKSEEEKSKRPRLFNLFQKRKPAEAEAKPSKLPTDFGKRLEEFLKEQ